VYAVLDACDTPSIPIKARELGETQAVSLYRGQAEEELWGIAPYLFRIDLPTFDWITETLWAFPWGFFAVSDAELDAVRHHFRRFLVVRSPNDEPWYFRFYDPRVLARFLTVTAADSVFDFFGPARAFAITDPETYGVRVFVRGGAGTQRGEHETVTVARR